MSLTINSNYNLKKHNTFNINANCKSFVRCTTIDDLLQYLKDKDKNLSFLIIGGGSNLLFINDFDGIVISPDIKGIDIISEDAKHIFAKVGAGVVWDDFVEFAVSKNYCGIENLSFIPGNVGASPIQNIGAYGIEVKDAIYEVEAVNIKTLEITKFSNADCKFAYRNSVFKNELKNKYIVLSVTFCLNKELSLKTNYGSINTILNEKGIQTPTLNDIRQIINTVRKQKLPDPEITGNAGSFFKNPIIALSKFQKLKEKYTEIPSYTLPDNQVKVPAAWLIDQCGWKGKRIGDAGVHKNQALVLINYNNASGENILELAKKIKTSIHDKFNIDLNMEVNIVR